MPLPAVIVPIAAGLGSAIGAVVASVVGFFSAMLTKKAAVAAAFAAFLVAGWIALQAALVAAWSALGWALPADMLVPLSFVVYLLPSNTTACLSAIVLAKIARWVWDNQREWARAVAQA